MPPLTTIQTIQNYAPGPGTGGTGGEGAHGRPGITVYYSTIKLLTITIKLLNY